MHQATHILDSNVYGELAVDPAGARIIRNVKEDKSLYVYGLDVIREELMAVPGTLVDRGEQIRNAILVIYQAVVDEEFSLPPLASYLASRYFEEFCRLRELGRYKKVIGTKALSKLRKFTEDGLRIDFQIVAAASLIGADIVVSMDARTILSPVAADAYGAVNAGNRLRTPVLVKFSEFREKHLGRMEK